jgi:hypothetical protein
MAGILDALRSKMQHATSGGLLSGGLLSGLGGGGGSGILSTHVGITQGRLATAQAASGGPVAKIQAILSSPTGGLGAHLRAGAGGGLLSGLGGGASTPASPAPTATDAFQVASAGRIYSAPGAPAGISYK